MSKFKVGQIWKDSKGICNRISKIDADYCFGNKAQPIRAGGEFFTVEGWYGETESEYRDSNLIELVQDVQNYQDTPKYVHGQLFNSTAEVLAALVDGKKVFSEYHNGFMQLVDGALVWDNGDKVLAPYINGPWSLYAPPSKRKSERWFAVFKSSKQKDGVKWKGPRTTKELSQEEFPNALDYVRAECEVEVEE